MDWLAIFPLIVGATSNLGALAGQAIAERLLTILLAVFIVGGVSVFALCAFAWLWMRRAVVEFHAPPSAAPR
jgi:hypothetical protein